MLNHFDWYKLASVPNSNFKIDFNFHNFKIMTFNEAAEFNALMIKHLYPADTIYLALSGGSDSEFMVRVCHSINLDFDVLIIDTEINKEELEYAYRLCDELNITPITVKVSQEHAFNYFMNISYCGYKNNGLNSTHQMLAAEKAKDDRCILVLGETPIHDYSLIELDAHAYESMPCMIHKDIIQFYWFTQEMYYAEIAFANKNKDKSIDEFKTNSRGIIRPKKYPKWDENYLKLYNNACHALTIEKLKYNYGTTDSMMKTMEIYAV